MHVVEQEKLVNSATTITDFCNQMGELGTNIKLRIRNDKHAKLNYECYKLRNIITWLDQQQSISWPISIKKFETPDFILELENKLIGVEVTESCPQLDGNEMAKEEGISGVHVYGDLGGYSSNDIKKNVEEVIVNLQKTITKKSTKKYEDNLPNTPIELWVYLNSNAAQLAQLLPSHDTRLAFFKKIEKHVYSDTSRFSRIIIMWNENRIVELKNENDPNISK